MAKTISLKRHTLILLLFLSFIGIVFVTGLSVRAYQVFSHSPRKLETEFEDIKISHSKIDNSPFENNLWNQLEEDFKKKFYDTVKCIIGDETLPLPDPRIVLYIRPDLHVVTIFYDYAYPCGACPTFPMWRVNVVADTLTNELTYKGIIYNILSPNKYLTYNSIK